MPAPVRYFNRRTGMVEDEQIYGERALRWTYESGLGRVALALLVKRPLFSRWFGWRMNRPASAAAIAPFIRDYGLDPAEFAESPEAFANFNAFFFRKLKPAARPIAAAPDALVFPADGRHLCIPVVGRESRVFAKGQRFDLEALLGPDADRFLGGSLMVSRLCPVDYHRFHFPCAGTPGPARQVDGMLFSVSPIALARKLGYLWQNKREVTIVETSAGPVALIEIGATCVGTIHQTYRAGTAVAMGAEKGYFSFGGSCVITVFPPGRIQFDDAIVAASAGGMESYARMGEPMGRDLAAVAPAGAPRAE